MNIKYLKWKMIGNDGFLLNLVVMPQSMFYHGQLYKEETPIHFWVSYHKGNKYYTELLRKNILIS